MPAPNGNQFAVKRAGEPATCHLSIRVTPRDKSSWILAAKGRAKRKGLPADNVKIAEWIIAILNNAADDELKLTGKSSKQNCSAL